MTTILDFLIPGITLSLVLSVEPTYNKLLSLLLIDETAETKKMCNRERALKIIPRQVSVLTAVGYFPRL